ncbi:calcium-binding protein [Agrobacterium larrymoorei]|uniref:peroxidase family protein n=1 Tax=Agrobacterium larrymoorei TaxID=160699 RepID=UPI001572F2D3|nr:peroxidase family protein [Agrobacterium larrymoorei]NTJ43914.1 calcium-binding protein [Agrobacterium larrymoorei]
MAAFTLNQADLAFVLYQIKVAEVHASGVPLTEIRVNPDGTVVSDRAQYDASTGVYLGNPNTPRAIPDPHVPVGLRTVDGSYNNIVPGREHWGSADQAMPRALDPNFINDADGDRMPLGGPIVVTNTDYGVVGTPTTGANGGHTGNVADADPRIISNLISDMSINNPAAVTAWFNNPLSVAAWEAANPGKVPVAPGQPLGENGQHITNADLASILNISPDEGLSAPFNAWMTFFGQFFDHGLDLISKGNNGTVFIPLQADDPLVVGPDGAPGGGDDLPAHLRFMVITRADPIRGPGADGVMGTADDTSHEARNTTTPFVDQNQTYTSHASHQVFLREYAMVGGVTVATGRLLDGPPPVDSPPGTHGGLPTWADIKANAQQYLGIQLTDADVVNLPLIRTDQYGNFIPDPVTGYAQLVTGLGADGVPNTSDDIVVSGTPLAPVNTFTAGALRIGHAFLDDIAHNANPFSSRGDALTADADNVINGNGPLAVPGTYDNELLDRHYVTGDGRGNENIGLTAVHHIFHSEHNRQVDSQKLTILESGDVAFINEWLATDINGLPIGFDSLSSLDKLAYAKTLNWDGERMFQAARFATEMQYQHLVFEEFARKIQPAVDVFVFNSITDVDPSIFAEFAHTVYRFGHSMLTDGMPRVFLNADGTPTEADEPELDLISAFLNPVSFDLGSTISADQAAGAIVRGMVTEHGNEIDEFIVSSLRNNLLGLPLDLGAINIARGRDTGMPSLNDARAQLYAASGSSFLKPYDNWVDLASNLKNSASVINFIAAYGTHSTITSATTLAGKRAAATALVMGGDGAPGDRVAYLTSTGAWANVETGLGLIDLWIGGLAEKKMPFGGMLGSTFNAIFELQLENLQDGDRFYYLTRTQGQNFLNMLEQNSFAKMIMANTDIAQPGADGIRGTGDDVIARHLGVDAFANYDHVLEINKANQVEADPEGDDPIMIGLGLNKVQRDDLTTGDIDESVADTSADQSGATGHYLRFTGGEHVVVGGTIGNDTIITDFGDDGIWGDDGDDRIESGAGVDLVNGGAGNDIITDSGDTGDFIKGDEGDDVIANSNGIDILMGGTGKDVIFVGVDSTEVFGGAGDDFILGGDGADFLLGNEGDDWMEAGGGFDTTAGDNSELFFNSAIKGHDVMFAGNDEHDFDAESGDDIMVQGESVIRNEGMFGFDWAIFKGVERDAYADMRVPIFTTEQADILRNRFDKTEALSGWKHDDTLLGDDRVFGEPAPGATVATTEGIFFNDDLTQAGANRIEGLRQLLGNLIAAAPTSGDLESVVAFNRGNLLLGGDGSDSLRGNGGDDFLDGDAWLNVRIRITAPGADNLQANQIATVDSLKHVFTAQENPAWAGKSLFELMISRTIVPNQLHIVREVVTSTTSGNVDTAEFNDIRANYSIVKNADGTFTVTHNTISNVVDPLTERNLVSDGVDTLRNIEFARFSDGVQVALVNVPATGVPVISDTTPTEGQPLNANTAGISDLNGLGTFRFQWQMSANGTTWTNVGTNSANFTPQQAQVGQQVRVVVSFTDGFGAAEQVISAPTEVVGDFINGTNQGTLINGTAGADTINGNGGNDAINGLAGNDAITGGTGNDTINAGAGDDVITWNANLSFFPFFQPTDGRDIVDGGTEGTVGDTFIVNGNLTTETYRVYTRAAAITAGMTGIAAATEIVITRNGVNNASIIAELTEIEEIVINTGLGNDTVLAIGNFSPTNLNFNTITINGGAGDETVNISGLMSAHRILFRSNGGEDTIVGTLRPQDVVEVASGQQLSSYTLTDNGNGTKTFSNGTHSITFTGSVVPHFQESSSGENYNDNGVSGDFEYTASDLAGLKALVNGLSPEDSDDAVPTGVRELSGHGNNVGDPDAGAVDMPFIRLTDAHYGAADANGNLSINPIFEGLDPRNISNILGAQEADLPKAEDANIFFMAFGQYFDHGLDFLGKGGNGSIQIGAPGNGAPGSGNPADLTRGTVAGYENGVPQHINKTSPFADQNQAYGSNDLLGQFLREGDGSGGLGAHLLQGGVDPSNAAFKLLPTLRELILHHWENNTVFHSLGLTGGQVSFRDYFPGLVVGGVITQSMVPAMASNFMGSTHSLLLDTNPYINLLDHYVAGDGRANENVALTSMHTIWARNHNFHVEGLEAAGFDGTPEELFQAAKMINEAEYQRVVFTEFADKLIGGMRGLGDHGFSDYNPDATAAISHEFAAAVYRVGHSLIGQTLTVMDANGNPTQVALFDAFLNPTNDPSAFNVPLSQLAQHGYVPQAGYEQHGVSAILSGIATQPAEAVDFNIVDAVRNDLVRINADLFAFNVARGWDVGLGTLNQVRMDLAASTDPYVAEARGFAGALTAYTSWEDFQVRNALSNAVIAQFKQAYPDLVLDANEIAAFREINPGIEIAMQPNGTGIVKGIDRVDLWVGGLAEKHINGGMVGQTFWVVLHEQFDRLQEADRFYYTQRFDNFDFYENFIDGQQFADIIARNTGLTDLQEDIFSPRIDDNGEDGENGGEDDDDDNDGDDDGQTGGNDDDDDGDNNSGGGDDNDDDTDDGEDDDNGGGDDGDDDDTDTGHCPNDDDDDDNAGNDDDDDDGEGTVTPLPVAAVALIGTAAGEVLAGQGGDDTILAGGGSDILSGNAGNDILRGEDGDDVIVGAAGRDVINGGAGDDEVHGGDGDDLVFGNAGADLLFGDAGNDVIEGGAGDDQAWGGEGNDIVLATANDGNDRYWGDAGTDTLDYSVATANLTVDLGNGLMGHGSVSSATTGSDTFYGFENFVGGSGHDVITASNAANVMDGGLGNDTFRFTTTSAADGDSIYGFQPGDKIDFSAIDANTGVAGKQTFAINGQASLTAVGGVAITHETRDGEDFTVIRGHTDADGNADFELAISGKHHLTTNDFTGVA